MQLKALSASQHVVSIFIHLPQDLDLLAPILLELQSHNTRFNILLHHKLLRRSPRITAFLKQHDIPWTAVRLPWDLVQIVASLRTASHLITASESSTRAHRWAHRLTRLARWMGLKTLTLQHGFENIGLTYSDSIHDIKNLKFASDKILIWSNKGHLHANIPAHTLQKCIEFGCTKDDSRTETPRKPASFVISVFENLHWHRYSSSYREQFIEDFFAAANHFRDFCFLLKPHHDGRWFTQQKQIRKAENVMILNPQDPLWEPFTAPSIAKISDLVITTPSTTAVDAAAMNLPVLLVDYDNLSEKYNPLVTLTKTREWIDAIQTYSQDPLPAILKSQEFYRRTQIKMKCAAQIFSVLD